MIRFKSWIEVSKKALMNNLRVFRKLTRNNIKIAAVVKANAYGHGLAQISQVLANEVDLLAVDSLVEALKLRSLKIRLPVLVLGYTSPDQFSEARANNISFNYI